MSAFSDRYRGDVDLALGDLARRVATLSGRAFRGCTPPLPCDDNPLIPAAKAAIVDYRRALAAGESDRAKQPLWQLLESADEYLAMREPAKLIDREGGSDRVSRILWNGLEAVRIAATALEPISPEVARRVLASIASPTAPGEGEASDGLSWGGTPTGALLPDRQPPAASEAVNTSIENTTNLAEGKTMSDQEGAPEPQVEAPQIVETAETGERAEVRAEPEPEADPRIDIEQFFEVDLRVARVTLAEAIPKSNKLLRLEVDLGTETRQVVAGIAKQYAPEDLVGRQVVMVANLKPAKLMGVESQGMVLAATVDGAPVLLRPDVEVAAGARVR